MVNVQRETPVAVILRDITKYISLIRILARPGELFAIEIGHSGSCYHESDSCLRSQFARRRLYVRTEFKPETWALVLNRNNIESASMIPSLKGRTKIGP
ncbi:MAG: hypothetical protein K0Q83_4178 [Deltaproteobacteria bacterium]|jgi:hypothetical protein|nr:hypothetical protein [Deltaproteobacteria bacterium]